jgi:hypothetical protein
LSLKKNHIQVRMRKERRNQPVSSSREEHSRVQSRKSGAFLTRGCFCFRFTPRLYLGSKSTFLKFNLMSTWSFILLKTVLWSQIQILKCPTIQIPFYLQKCRPFKVSTQLREQESACSWVTDTKGKGEPLASRQPATGSGWKHLEYSRKFCLQKKKKKKERS